MILVFTLVLALLRRRKSPSRETGHYSSATFDPIDHPGGMQVNSMSVVERQATSAESPTSDASKLFIMSSANTSECFQIGVCPHFVRAAVRVQRLSLTLYRNIPPSPYADPESPVPSYTAYPFNHPGGPFSTQIGPTRVSIPEPVTPSYNQGTPTGRSLHATPSISGASASQRRALTTSLYSPAIAASVAIPQSPSAVIGQETDPPDALAVLNTVTRMDPAERLTLVSVLNTLVAQETSGDQPGSIDN